MTGQLRWRILSLQIVVTLVLVFCAGFLFWAAAFTHSQVHDQLAAQKIAFPPANNAAITALKPVDANPMKQYAGQTLTTGDQAQVYANHFIAVHLGEMGMTYSQVSAKYLANPKDQKIAGLRQTIFMGTMLRGTLLQAYAWWTVGSYALYAALGLTFASILVFLAFLFELLIVPKREGIVRLDRSGKPIPVASVS